MKSLKELEEIRKKTLENINLRKGREGYRVVVGMATCGIAAGARLVLMAIMDEIKNLELTNVTVAQTGCIGACRLEPIVEVYSPEGEKVTYIKMDPQKAKAMVESHIKSGKVIDEYTMTVIEGKIIDPVIKED
ncbi:(2Fe-2S) ferredoxin domain-containing protein [Irregularibacter muris]|uniref:(2Fe-2S) ferredoxin domain-containing protein n=1 Tax=Irregularibacter muris TaxID=1796619 RepID=A0AAE3HI87_9FIRM|nr:(2Fe-2S) ferredoxin domain-containing protein [Irregularibacter muris]MCR1899885.1 (2Fe-2S) ferredoxin domain-containing protein [Irregularibacter muris]